MRVERKQRIRLQLHPCAKGRQPTRVGQPRDRSIECFRVHVHDAIDRAGLVVADEHPVARPAAVAHHTRVPASTRRVEPALAVVQDPRVVR
eukprot:1003133-Prymnesium_polylepis.2